MVQTQNFIQVSFSIPQETLLSDEIAFGTKDGRALRDMDCYKDCALLVELANGFLGRKPDGSYAHPTLRESVHKYKGRGEWTADHVDYDAETPAGIVVPKGYARVKWIQFADEIKERKGKFYAEGGNIIPVELPSNGWQIPVKDGNEFRMYHPVTGSPLATLPRDKKEEAIKMLKDAGYDKGDLSYFYRADNGLRAVLRDFLLDDYGPFYVYALYGPDNGDSDIGSRSCRRSEPLLRKGDVRGVVVGISPKEYQRFLSLEKFCKNLQTDVSALEKE